MRVRIDNQSGSLPVYDALLCCGIVARCLSLGDLEEAHTG